MGVLESLLLFLHNYTMLCVKMRIRRICEYVTAGRLNWSKMSKWVNWGRSVPQSKTFSPGDWCPPQGSCKVRVRCSSSVQCQLGPRHVVGALACSVPDLENWHIWGMRRIRAHGRLFAGLGASEGCDHE